MRSVWLRRALLLVTFLLVGWVALYLFGSAGRPKSEERSTALSDALDEEIVARGEGFDVGVYDGDELVFLLSGETVTSDSENRISLQGVHLEVTREGRPYKIWSEAATFREGAKEAILEGNVRVEGPDGLQVETEKISLLNKGRLLESQSPVAFAWGEGVLGRAQRLRSDFSSRVHLLSGQVLIRRSAPEGSDEADLEVRASKISLDREGQLLRADGMAEIRYGESLLTARRLSAHLSKDGKKIRFIHANWNVSARFVVPGEGGRLTKIIRAKGRSLSVLMEGSGKHPEEVELEGAAHRPGVLRVADETGQETTIEARYLSADFRDGLPSLVETWGGVSIREGFSFDPEVTVRMACADVVDATFQSEGRLSEMQMRGNVYYHEGGMQILGAEAKVEQGGKKVKVSGEPAKVSTARAELSAPTLVYTESSGVLRAEGGVHGLLRQLDQGRLDETPLGRGEGPLFIESAEAFLEKGNSFSFREQVRAWRDEALLTADQIRGDPEKGELSASGSVRTVWNVPEQEDGEGQGPIDVTADRLAYRQEENLLVYSGEVVVVQDGRRMSCDEAQLKLRSEDSGSSVDWMDCSGETKFSDPATGREALADRVLYRPSAKIVELFGSPAKWSDSQGHKMEGQHMIYDMATGAVRVRSEVSSPGPGG